jgi:signal transduction histidine kinase
MVNESRPSDYVAAINHELRTPLNAILGFSSLLADAEALDQRHRRYAEHILVSGQRLLGLVDEVLALARLAGEAPFLRAPALESIPASKRD